MEAVDALGSSRKKTRNEIRLEEVPITMKYQYQGQTHASTFEDKVQWIIDTKINIKLEAIK